MNASSGSGECPSVSVRCSMARRLGKEDEARKEFVRVASSFASFRADDFASEVRGAVRRGIKIYSRRRELAGACVSRRGRKTFFCKPRGWRARVRCRWQRTYRLRRHVGPGNSRSCASQNYFGGENGGGCGNELWNSQSI